MSDVELATKLKEDFELFKIEISKVIIGQDEIIKNILISTFCGGHCLLVGVPGLAKTLLVQTFSKVLGLDFKRIQFTPDLMPSDITGTEIISQDKDSGQREFKFINGPIFSNIVLADEINRTPPKTQSALLEAMQENNVTIGNKTYELDSPFFVLATQNPIEQEGTYPLPEAQLDRFMFNIVIEYPSFEEEIEVVKLNTSLNKNTLEQIISKTDLKEFQELIINIPVADNVIKYAVDFVHKTRPNYKNSPKITKKYLDWGAGPRASSYLILAAKAYAALNGCPTPEIEHVNSVVNPILRHRIIPNFNSEAEGIKRDDILNELLNS